MTKCRIDTLQNYFGLAIRQNVGDVIAMQRNLMASLYHVCSTDENPNHHMCPSDDNSWCGYNRNKDTFRHVHGLPDALIGVIEPIYDDLLCKCLHGMTQNNNECLNKLIWDRCPNETFVSRLVIEDATYSAVSYFNDGSTSIKSMLCELKLVPGHFTIADLHKADDIRIYFAKRKSLQTSKKRRKILRAKKKNFQDKK